MEKFFANIKKIDEAGCSYTLEITPNDEYIPHIEDIKKVAIENCGALPHITVARNNKFKERPILTSLTREEYIKTWSVFDSTLFDYKIRVFNEKRNEFCNAGAWTYYLNIGTGDLKQCYRGKTLQNIYKNPNEPIKVKPIGYKCPEAHCFNAHAWLCFGAIKDHDAPTYLEVRDRETNEGAHWVKEPVYSFFKSKLKEKNIEKENTFKALLNMFGGG